MSRFTPLAVLALLAISFQNAHAGTISINGIAPFDTNLGTLIHVLVTIDPPNVPTSVHTSAGPIGSHQHLVSAPPIVIPGLDTFTFATLPTTPKSSGGSNEHHHSIDLVASIKSYTGPSLSWFLDAGNPTITSIIVPPFATASNAGHDHTVNLLFSAVL